jgi:hypothetical protein
VVELKSELKMYFRSRWQLPSTASQPQLMFFVERGRSSWLVVVVWESRWRTGVVDVERVSGVGGSLTSMREEMIVLACGKRVSA